MYNVLGRGAHTRTTRFALIRQSLNWPAAFAKTQSSPQCCPLDTLTFPSILLLHQSGTGKPTEAVEDTGREKQYSLRVFGSFGTLFPGAGGETRNAEHSKLFLVLENTMWAEAKPL